VSPGLVFRVSAKSFTASRLIPPMIRIGCCRSTWWLKLEMILLRRRPAGAT
jgi:hypothetical protein